MLHRALSLTRFAVVMLIAFACAVAYAQVAPAAPTPIAMVWPLLGVAVPALWGAVAKYLTGRFAFLHDGVGHTAITLLGALIGAAVSSIQTGWNATACIVAVLGAATSFFGALSAGTAGEDARAAALGQMQMPRSSSNKGALALWLLLVLGFAGLLGVVLAGCGTTAGAAASACEVGQLSSEEQSAFAEVQAIAQNPSSTVQDLEQLALKLGQAQVSCAVAALQGWIAGSAPKGGRMAVALGETLQQHAAQVCAQYLAAHPAHACRPTTVRVRAAECLFETGTLRASLLPW